MCVYYFVVAVSPVMKLMKHCNANSTIILHANKGTLLNSFVSQGNFGGRCMLYGLVDYNATADLIAVKSSSSSSLCYFVATVSVMVAVVCFLVSLYWLYMFCIDGEIRR